MHSKRRALPCINHPVFKGKPVNVDPREVFVRQRFEARGEYNVFHDYYRALVQALYDENVTRNVFAVNVDAVIASVLLKMLWARHRAGDFPNAGARDRGLHGLSVRPDDRLRRGDRRPPESRPQSRHSHASGECPIRRMNGLKAATTIH